MNDPLPLPARLWLRTDVRLGLVGVAALLAVWLGFLGVSVEAAEVFVKRSGYYVLLATFAVIFPAELPDKSFIATLVLATISPHLRSSRV